MQNNPSDYIITPPGREKYKEGKIKRSKECIFCVAAAKAQKIKMPKVIANVHIIATFKYNMLVVNAYPYVPRGHLMIVPFRHMEDMDNLTENEIKEIFMKILPKAKASLEKEYKDVTGFNIGINIGRSAGASYGHLHIHVVPRLTKERGFMETTIGIKIIEEPAQITMKKIAKYFR